MMLIPSKLLVIIGETMLGIRQRTGTLRNQITIQDVSIYAGVDRAPAFLCLVETSDERVLAALALNENVFELLSGWPRGETDGKRNGLLVGLTNCRDAAREDEFHDWYDNVHAADVIKSPFYWRARRFKKISGSLPNFLALYDTELSEPQALQQYLRWPERDATMHPAAEIANVWTFNLIEKL